MWGGGESKWSFVRNLGRGKLASEGRGAAVGRLGGLVGT